ncbi:hypothetical protein DFQ27_005185 [Actinomortierella ambigua]|uniref:FAD-binding domain-containing protein n=1 Tax=Actinomortierella ambigua TaxID=1343610 RepID=A0A9P6U2Z5_9FUNG|nr:hypothetical protein DFQ27_005185 [Actinomortierella ambigua]
MVKDIKVLLVGGGIGSLTLALLLERANIDYEIYERASEVKPLGSAITFGPGILATFKQLGIYDEYAANSTIVIDAKTRNQKGDIVMYNDYSMVEERYGMWSRVITRPTMYKILMDRIPSHKLHFSKKVVRTDQNAEGVMLHFADGTTAHGDILVGADGAYSTVRQCLYKQLGIEGRLPASDLESFPYEAICLVGVTDPFPPGTFVHEKGPEYSRFEAMLSDDKRFMWVLFSMPDHSVAWMVITNQEGTSQKADDPARFNAEWGPGAAESMTEFARNLPSPFGGKETMERFINATPKSRISKIMLEEKIFDTWYDGRTVLLGDACHKLFPAAGQGGVCAMQDAVALANALYAMPSNSPEDIEIAFEAYREERWNFAKDAFDLSHNFGKVTRPSWTSALLLFVLQRLPQSLWVKQLDGLAGHRPQASFLPLYEHAGFVKPLPLTDFAKVMQDKRTKYGKLHRQ